MNRFDFLLATALIYAAGGLAIGPTRSLPRKIIGMIIIGVGTAIAFDQLRRCQ